MSGSTTGGGGPCGACKFLRRKCVAECVFAPYFDSEQGSAHFAAVHKVFGASNASKLLTTIPASQRLDAVVTLSYEALARLRDPVYGCVGHIFALQRQVMSLQAELAYVETHLSMLQQQVQDQEQDQEQERPHPPPTKEVSSSHITSKKNLSSLSQPQEDFKVSTELADLATLFDPMEEEGDLNALARKYVSKYFTADKFRQLSPI